MVPDWATRLDWNAIRDKSAAYRLSPELVACVIQTESEGQVHCMRAEVKKTMTEAGVILLVSTWRYFEEPDHFADQLKPFCSRSTEWTTQLMGWGPMQVQGSVARELGFTGWFSELCSWDLGVEYGCKQLRRKADRYGDAPDTLYAAYNAGSPRRDALGKFDNQKNVDRFMAFYRALTALA
jgi:hypothetical protein